MAPSYTISTDRMIATCRNTQLSVECRMQELYAKFEVCKNSEHDTGNCRRFYKMFRRVKLLNWGKIDDFLRCYNPPALLFESKIRKRDTGKCRNVQNIFADSRLNRNVFSNIIDRQGLRNLLQ